VAASRAADQRPPIERKHWPQSLADPTGFYHEAFAQFHTSLPQAFREHRAYFHNVPRNRRGYGEDAFHTLWYWILEEFRPTNFLEIGVFRGQVISLVTLWAKLRGVHCEVHGISPFSSAGDSVTTYRQDIDYYQDTLANFDHFVLNHPTLVKAYSTDPEARNHISSRVWDMIYIDGNHDYEVVSQDWQLCSANLRAGGVVVLDDSGLTTSFVAPPIASSGHPGPSGVASEIDSAKFQEILQVGHNRAFIKCA
jgi:hypothetical protein